MDLCRITGKVRHPSRGKAQAALRSLKKRIEYSGHTYPCIYCRGYHVGQLRKRAHRSRYAVAQTEE